MKTQMEMNWSKYLRVFSEHNRNRPTRLGVHQGPPGSMSDLWLEDGLPLLGVDVAARPERLDVEIMLGPTPEPGRGPKAAHMSHRVFDARSLRIVLGASGQSDALEIENANGETTVMQFEEVDRGL